MDACMHITSLVKIIVQLYECHNSKFYFQLIRKLAEAGAALLTNCHN